MYKIVILACLVAAISAQTACGSVCDVYCPYGNVLDEKQCPTCQCKEAPLSALTPIGDACGPVLCLMFCAEGWQKDERGCDICACAGQQN